MEEYNTNINSERKCYIILTVGIPGIGKSTFCSALCNYLNSYKSVKVFHIEFDKIEQSLIPQDVDLLSSELFSPEIWKEARSKAYETVKSITNDSNDCNEIWIILDDNFYYRSMRKPYLRLAGKLNKSERTDERSKFSTIYTEIHFKGSIETAIQRNHERERRIPKHIINRMAHIVERPEGPSIDWDITNKNNDDEIENIISYIKQITPAECKEEIEKVESPSSQTFNHQVDILLRKCLNIFIKELKSKAKILKDNQPMSPNTLADNKPIKDTLNPKCKIDSSHPFSFIAMEAAEISQDCNLDSMTTQIEERIVVPFREYLENI